jgi:hypothetical protein
MLSQQNKGSSNLPRTALEMQQRFPLPPDGVLTYFSKTARRLVEERKRTLSAWYECGLLFGSSFSF